MQQQQDETVTIVFKDGRVMPIAANQVRSITSYQPNQLTERQPQQYPTRHHPSEFNQAYKGIGKWVALISLGIVGSLLLAAAFRILTTPVIVNSPPPPAPVYNPNCWIGCSGG